MAPGQLCQVTHSALSPFPTPCHPSVGHGDVGVVFTICVSVMTLKCGTHPIGGHCSVPLGCSQHAEDPVHACSPPPHLSGAISW